MKNKGLTFLGITLLGMSIAGCDVLMPKKTSSNKSSIDDSQDSYESSQDSFISSGNDYSSNNSSSSDGDQVDPDPSDYELNDNGFRKLIKDSYEFCEDLMQEGSVLLKNENNVLPLKENERKVTLFGQGSKNIFYRSGAGGAAPNNDLVVSLDQTFEDNGFNINHTVFDAYTTLNRGNMTSPNTNVEHSFSGFYTDAMKNSFYDYSDAAIVTFVRIGTENTDPQTGKLDLSNDEKELLKMIKDSGAFNKTIVLINSPMPMSMDWAEDPELGVDAIMYIGAPGYYGLGGVVNLIKGQDNKGNPISPSGHAPFTFAASASSSPAYANFGGNSVVVYQEGIYVGYKYYETRYEDLILGRGNADSNKGVFKSVNGWDYASEMGYPFGYGLSYTNFQQELTNVKYNASKDTIEATVKVKNIGNMDGKASVQLYVHAPYTDFDKSYGLGKSAIALMAYDKVNVAKGATEEVTLSFDRYQLCTYDYKFNRSYILEGGDYHFAIGNGAHEALNNVLAYINPQANLFDHTGMIVAGATSCVKVLSIEKDSGKYKHSIYGNNEEITNQFDDADYNYFANKNGKSEITYLDRQDWNITYPESKITVSPANNDDLNMSKYYQKEFDCPSYVEGDGIDYNVQLDKPITFAEMKDVPLEGKVTKGKFAGQEGSEVWDKFINQMDLNDLVISISDNRGILDVGKVMKKGNIIGEGSEGLLARFKYGDKRWATGFPTGPVCTGSWDHSLQKKYGDMFAEEARFAGVNCVNGVGTNIFRTAYTSRGSEYMSEDGVLNYNTAANVVGAARNKGLIMNIKHAFLNNQETGRQRLQTYCNEQAIREIYLKGFEGALTKGQGLGIMTTYNRIGARYSACHEPFMKNVLRGEWGYQGFIIDDALTGSNNDNYSNGPAMLHSGTDLFCLDGNRGNQLKAWVTNNDDGQILEDLQRANKYIMYAMSRSSLLFDESGSNVPEDSLIIKEQVEWDFSDPELAEAINRSPNTMDPYYVFEGSYAEGYQGDYSETFGNLYLWEDGIYSGKIGQTNVYGYWYNSSLNNNTDKPDCLNMVSNIAKYESIICDANENGEYYAYVYLRMSWGGDRSMILVGHRYNG